MASETQPLGRFVRTRPLKDGNVAVFMSVPQRLRPQGWPPTLQLPLLGKKVGSLNDRRFRDRVQRDADLMNRRLDERRAENARVIVPNRRTLVELSEVLMRTARVRRLSEGRQRRARLALDKIIDWSVARGLPPFADILKADVEDFLFIYDDKPQAQTEMLQIWKWLSIEAIGNRWRLDNPCAQIPWPKLNPKRVNVWPRETVERYAAGAEMMGQPGLAALIRFGFESGQRLGDLRRAQHGRHFNGERFTIKQSKTGAVVSFLVAKRAGSVLERARYAGSPYLFTNYDTGTAFTVSDLNARFTELRIAMSRPGEEKLLLRALRHSAVCRMVDVDVPLLKIASVTGHAPNTVDKIIKRYAVDYERFADDAMRMLNRAEGGTDDDFSDTKPVLNEDWLAAEASRDTYTGVPFNPDRPWKYLPAATGQHRRKWSLPYDAPIWPEFGDAHVDSDEAEMRSKS